jgi:hypothetical protein
MIGGGELKMRTELGGGTELRGIEEIQGGIYTK